MADWNLERALTCMSGDRFGGPDRQRCCLVCLGLIGSCGTDIVGSIGTATGFRGTVRYRRKEKRRDRLAILRERRAGLKPGTTPEEGHDISCPYGRDCGKAVSRDEQQVD